MMQANKKEHLKNSLYVAVTAVLFVTMLVLCGMYLDLTINGMRSSLPGLPEQDKWQLSHMSEDASAEVSPLIQPTFIGFKTPDGGKIAAAYDKDAVRRLFDKLKGYMVSLSSGMCFVGENQTETEKMDYVRTLCDSETYLYACFYDELPQSVFLPAMQGGGYAAAFPVNFYIKYLFILPDEEGSAYAVCLDRALNAVTVTAKEPPYFDQTDFSAYTTDRGFAAFDFVSDGYPDAYFTESFTVGTVMLAKTSSFSEYRVGDQVTETLLRVFDFNRNMAKNYYSKDGKVISFVEDGRELSLCPETDEIVYDGGEAGLPLSLFLRYRPSGEDYTFSDMVLALKAFLNAIDRVVIGGEAYPALIHVGRDKDEAVFRLKYLYNGVLITEKESDIVVKMKNNAITGVEIDAAFCVGGNLERPVLPQRLLVDAQEPCEYLALYEEEENADTVSLVFLARKKEA